MEKDSELLISTVIGVTSMVASIIGVAMWLSLRPQTTSLGSRESASASGLSVNIPRVHYDDGQVLVEVRNPGEWHNIRDFVQPDNPYLSQVIGEALSG